MIYLATFKTCKSVSVVFLILLSCVLTSPPTSVHVDSTKLIGKLPNYLF